MKHNYTRLTNDAQKEREAILGQRITNNTDDLVLQGGIILEHLEDNRYIIYGEWGSFFALHNKSKNFWTLS